MSGSFGQQGPVVRGDGALLTLGARYDGPVEPRARDVIGAAALAVILVAFVVILVVGNIPHH